MPKDNPNTRKDIESICNRPVLHLLPTGRGHLLMPKGRYTLTLNKKRNICEWVSKLRMPDGFSLNLANMVDIDHCKFSK